MKFRRLISEEQAERLKKPVCPRCKKYSLLRVRTEENLKMPNVKFRLGEYLWTCSGPSGSFCYILSDNDVNTLFETSDDVPRVSFEETNDRPPSLIVRRRAGSCVQITSSLAV